jgi:opacity protein-like surface antigen
MKSVLVILLLSFEIFSQTESQQLFSVNGKAGIMFPGTTAWIFSKDPSRWLADKQYTIYPGYYFGLGIESKDLLSVDNLGLYFGLDVSYGRSSTGEIELYYGPAEFELTSLPIMFWTSIKSKGNIVPFIKLGIGAEKTQNKETYELNPHFNFNVEDWFFAWGVGGGIDFNYLERVKFSVFVEGIITETGIKEKLPDGREIYYDSRNGSTYSGIQVGYYF